MTRCCGCGENFPESDGPTHPYMLSSPGCWAAYGELLAREYQNPAYARLHRLSVDAYAVQHPGVDTPQARNSVGIHLSRLCLILDRGWPIERANDAMVSITSKKKSYPGLFHRRTGVQLLFGMCSRRTGQRDTWPLLKNRRARCGWHGRNITPQCRSG